jgi:outer membrane lipase/esterase
MGERLHQIIVAIAVMVVVGMMPADAIAGSFSKVFIFGDSLSDTGNAFLATGKMIPQSPPYYQGRFSNGPVWVEMLGYSAKPFLAGGTNFAFGSATTQDLLLQVGIFLVSHFFLADPRALYVVWSGATDIRHAVCNAVVQDPTVCGAVGTVDAVCHNIAKVISILTGVGVRHFLVSNVPDIGLVPETRALALLDPNCHVDALDSCAVVQLASALTKEFNECLESQLQSLEAVSHRIEITRLDVFTLLDEVVADAAAAQKCGFTNVTDGCLDGDPLTFTSVCDEGGFTSGVPVASGHLFFDNQHPTVAGHTLLAEAAGKAISGLPALPACLVQ